MIHSLPNAHFLFSVSANTSLCSPPPLLSLHAYVQQFCSELCSPVQVANCRLQHLGRVEIKLLWVVNPMISYLYQNLNCYQKAVLFSISPKLLSSAHISLLTILDPISHPCLVSSGVSGGKYLLTFPLFIKLIFKHERKNVYSSCKGIAASFYGS
jgi:hypothetical protein